MTCRMTTTRALLGALTVLTAIAGCDLSSGPARETITFTYNFRSDELGWSADFTDFPVGTEEEHQLVAEHRLLPPPLNTEHRAHYLSGVNHSDDLFMFLRREITGFAPYTRYRVTFSVTFATNAPKGCVGVGGAPGESVYIKAGTAATRPERMVVNGDYRLSVDKGEQAEEGVAARVLGTAAGSRTDCDGDLPYESKTLVSGDRELTVESSADGSLWFFVGSESGFEARTSLYFTEIEIRLRRLN